MNLKRKIFSFSYSTHGYLVILFGILQSTSITFPSFFSIQNKSFFLKKNKIVVLVVESIEEVHFVEVEDKSEVREFSPFNQKKLFYEKHLSKEEISIVTRMRTGSTIR